MTKWPRLIITSVLLIGCFFASIPCKGYAQATSAESEVYLSFQYQGIVNTYITTYYKDGEFYLPVGELFKVLKINHRVDHSALSVSGSYLNPSNTYYLDFNGLKAELSGNKVSFTAGEFLIKEIDYFIHPSILQELFGLEFTIDFNNLMLSLETPNTLPVVAQYEREQRRERLTRSKPIYERSFFPLAHDRNLSIFDGGYLDYNISTIFTPETRLLSLSNALGAEFLGGDIQGTTFGVFSSQTNSFTTNNLRWRYVQRNSDFFSSAVIGQTSSEGIASRAFTGVKISNKPVEPRLLFDRYVIEGHTVAQSEVELYLNNSLIDFQQTDQSGNYRFVVPLTYGSTNYSVRIYTPSGQSIERTSRIQIPFDYLPPGDVDYSISGGKLNNPILGSVERGYLGEASVAAGITDWLTAKASTEYLSNYHSTLPSFTGTLSARLFSNYLLSADINSENFYRFSSSVVYSSGASWSLLYDYNPGDSRLYNVGGNDHQTRINLFTPFQLGSIPLNIRWSSTYQQRDLSRFIRYRIDLNSRFNRLNVRVGYQDQQVDPFKFTYTPASRITNSYTYTLGRRPGIPSYLKGTFIRGQLSYLPGFNQFEELEFQLSRDVFNTGRLQLTYGHNFLGEFNTFSLNFTVDFNKIRSNTTSRSTGSAFSFSQNFRGSVGFSPGTGKFMLHNRQQVGQAGAAVRLFVDNNNDGTYQPGLDSIINDQAVRLSRAGGRTTVEDGVNYISQLLPYYQYDIQINESALTNPLLVPEIEDFSFVTDPNQYKPIEIPFYLSGVISGKVQHLQRDNSSRGLGGIRLYLESIKPLAGNENYFNEELRTFSDGSFYTYEVPPGRYNLYIDPSQLNFLDAVSRPDTMQIEVKALSQGDFIEGLAFTIVPADFQEEEDPVTVLVDSVEPEISAMESWVYQIQLASLSTEARAEKFAATANIRSSLSFGIIYNTVNGLYAVRSNPLHDRGQAIEQTISLQDEGFEDAALVAINVPAKSAKNLGTRNEVVQIGAFESKYRAEAFAALSAIKLDGETTLRFDRQLNLHTVFFSAPGRAGDQQLQATLEQVRQKPYFSDAFITSKDGRSRVDFYTGKRRPMYFAFQVQIKGVFPESEQAFLSSLLEDMDATLARPKSNFVILDNISSWQKAQDLRKRLSKISSLGRPVVVLIEIDSPELSN